MSARTLRAVRPETVARYESVDGAIRAAAHLIGLGYDPDDITISPRDYQVVDDTRLLRRVAANVKRYGVIAGCLVAALVVAASVGLDTLVQSVLPAMIIAAITGAFVGVVAAVVQHRRASVLTWDPKQQTVAPTSFDIGVADDADSANRDLARWWDPAAPPAPWRRSA